MVGQLFVIEGTDGSGKTTIRRHLFGELRRRGIDVLAIQGSCWLNPAHARVMTGARFHGDPYPPETIAAAYLGDKEALTSELLRPHLRYRHVLCDRYIVSDVVLQARSWGMPPTETYLRYFDSGVLRPDLTLFIDTPPDLSVDRLASRPAKDRHPWEEYEQLRYAYDIFVELLFSGAVPPLAPVVRVDGARPQEEVLETVSQVVMDRIAARARSESRLPSH